MVLLDNYIGRAVIGSVVSVLFVLTVLFLLISFAGEFDDIGKHGYTFWKALWFVVLRSPRQVYELFPLATILGTMLGLGALAARSELTIVRSAGISIGRIVLSVLRASLLLMLMAFVLGEVVAPPTEQYAQQMRLTALAKKISLDTNYGLWIREGQNFLHVQQVNSKGKLTGIYLYAFDNEQRLQTMTQAQNATYYQESGWTLTKVQRSVISGKEIKTQSFEKLEGFPLLPIDVIDTVSVAPDTLAVWKLNDYINYLYRNGLDAGRYELALWNKLLMPFSISAMVLLALPFVLGSLRSVSVGQRVLTGFLLGITFFILNKLAGHAGLVYEIPPLLGASLPTLLVLIGALILFRQAR